MCSFLYHSPLYSQEIDDTISEEEMLEPVLSEESPNDDPDTQTVSPMDSLFILSPLFGQITNALYQKFDARMPNLTEPNPDGTYPLEKRKISILETDKGLIGGLFAIAIVENLTVVNFMFASHVNEADVIGSITYADYYFLEKTDLLQPNVGLGFTYNYINGHFTLSDEVYDDYIYPLYSITVNTQVSVPIIKAGLRINLMLDKWVSWLGGWYVVPYIAYVPEIVRVAVESPGGLLPFDPPTPVAGFSNTSLKVHHSLLVGFNFSIRLWYIFFATFKLYFNIPLKEFENIELIKKEYGRSFLITFRIRGNVSITRHWAIAYYFEYAEHSNNRNIFWLLGPAYAFY